MLSAEHNANSQTITNHKYYSHPFANEQNETTNGWTIIIIVIIEIIRELKYNKKLEISRKKIPKKSLLTTSLMRIYCYDQALTSNQQKH